MNSLYMEIDWERLDQILEEYEEEYLEELGGALDE